MQAVILLQAYRRFCKLTNLAPMPRLLAADTHERLAALCPTPDGRLLLAAGTSGLVTLRWLHSLQVGGGAVFVCWGITRQQSSSSSNGCRSLWGQHSPIPSF